MAFYPRTLKSNWYLADVCDYIFATLEGAKSYASYVFESKIERDAYVEALAECQQIVKDNDMKPQVMLQMLSDFHDTLPAMPPPPFFSRARWFYNTLEAKQKAVQIAFELVDGILARFLP